MATPSIIPVPKSGSGGIENVTTQTISTGTSGAEIALGPRQIFMLTAFAASAPAGLENICLKFGPAGLGAAAATDMGLPCSSPSAGSAPIVFGTGDEFTSIRVYNNTSASVTIWVMLLNPAG